MLNVTEKINKALQKEESEREIYKERRKEYAREKTRERVAASVWIKTLKPAKERYYSDWLSGYLEQEGNEITHVYNYRMPESFMLACAPLTVTPLYGARALSIIVPEHIDCKVESLGHNNIFYMKDFSCEGIFVPFYTGQ